MDHHGAVRLDHQEAEGLRQHRGEAAGVADLASGDDQAHEARDAIALPGCRTLRTRAALAADVPRIYSGRMALFHRGTRPALVTMAALAALSFGPAPASTSASPVASKPYSTQPGPSRPEARFVVTYKGKGTYSTVFHATPPNDGGKPDTNDAHDTSEQTWGVKFSRAIVIPACGQPTDGSADPCAGLTGLSGASGPTSVTGRVDHKHVDGLYRQLDRTVKCRLRKSVSPRRLLDASLGVRYISESQSFAVSASNPVATALSLFPTQCPKQGDSIDRIYDFYATPGFSFADFYGPDRWFASREIVIPATVLHRSKTVTIPLRNTAAGTPPKHCARKDPSFERCRTGGSWHGVLTFTARP
jgi:hypothetical protein